MYLYTIGHSAHPIEKFIDLLQMHTIQNLVDVRSVPASRFHPQYRKRNLERSLAECNISYVFWGQTLGGRPMDPACYPDDKLPDKRQKPWPRPDYERMTSRPWFIQSIANLLQLAEQSPTAILCSEEDPLHCHRHWLIDKYLHQHHPEVNVLHIRGDGNIHQVATLFEL